ncbi:hypothetical protein ACFE04_009687 [Oxalis oulophora]
MLRRKNSQLKKSTLNTFHSDNDAFIEIPLGEKKSPKPHNDSRSRITLKSLLERSPSSNPFDSDNESGSTESFTLSRSSSESKKLCLSSSSEKKTNPFDDSTSYMLSLSPDRLWAKTNRTRVSFCDLGGGLESKSKQQLEDYAVNKAEETCKVVNDCLQQGEHITKTHIAATEIERNLTRGEKILRKLGGLFSKTWKPKKTCKITGPLLSTDDKSKRRVRFSDKREVLGFQPLPKGRSRLLQEPTNALQKVEVEKAEQDDTDSDLSDALEVLKDMAVEMGYEIEWKKKGLDLMEGDINELNLRVRGANQQSGHLLRK